MEHNTLYDFNVRDNNNDTPLHLACQYSSADVVLLLAPKVHDFNVQNNYRNTPLSMAILRISSWDPYSRFQVIKYFLDHLANPNIQDLNGNTALHHAYHCPGPHSCEIISLLKRRGASDLILNKRGNRPSKVWNAPPFMSY
jgi:ankyrin repeat protein